jgi:hypothetical protein
MSEHEKKSNDRTPSVDELFVMSVRSAFDLAVMLKLDKKTFMKLIDEAWDIDEERRKEEHGRL